MGPLWDKKRELFAQELAATADIMAACQRANISSSAGDKWSKAKDVKARVNDIVMRAANRAEITRADLIYQLRNQISKAEELGQMGAAMKGTETLGREVFNMFIDKKEIGAPGEFDNKSAEELREIIANELNKVGLYVVDPAMLKHDAEKDSAKIIDLVPMLPAADKVVQ